MPLSSDRELVKRREDPRLLTGQGTYVADIDLPDMLELTFVRSTMPHAMIRSIDYREAERSPGVHLVLTARQLQEEAPSTLTGVASTPALAIDRVRYFGEPVAAVLADNRYLAEDAAELIEIEYDELPVLVDVLDAIRPDAVAIHESSPNNIANVHERSFGNFDALEERADVIIHETFRIHRASAQPLETRCLVAAPDPASKGIVVWTAHQGPHQLRNGIMNALGLAAHQVRVITPDVGGGFGQKNGVYPEDIVCCYLAYRMQRPVRWIEDRQEHFVSASHEREQKHEVTLLAKKDGTLLGIRDHCYIDQGAFLQRGHAIPLRTIMTLPGPYRMEAYEGKATTVFTNKVPVGPYRGAGRPQGNFIMERMMDRLARHLQLDPVEVRLKNLITPHEMPFDRGFSDHRNTRVIYDSGDYPGTLLETLNISNYETLRRTQAEQTRSGSLNRVVEGIGVSCSVEDTGGGGYEGAMIRLEPGGRFMLYTGSAAQGQGHETTFANIAARALGIPPDAITVVLGDTAHLTHGVGTFGSRSTVVAGGAVHRSTLKLKEQLFEIASSLLEVAADDLILTSDRIHVAGMPDRHILLKNLANQHPGLGATDYYEPDAPTYANGAHVCRCRIDLDLCRIELTHYYVTHDCGTLIDPPLVAGQVHGGVLHGLSTVLFEEHVTDESGQPLTTSYKDYLIPEATSVPPFILAHKESPSPLNPLGVKGAGEGGTVPALAAVSAAIEDALYQARRLGLIKSVPVINELPVSPERLFRMLQENGYEPVGPR